MNRFAPLACTTNGTVAPPDYVNSLVPGPRQYSDVVQKGPETLIVSNSITKGITVRDINERFDGGGHVSFRRFPGAKADDVRDYLPSNLSKVKPETVIIQSGGNDLPTPRSNPVQVEEIAKTIVECGLLCKSYGVKNVLISGVPMRRPHYLKTRCKDLNLLLQEHCLLEGFIFVDNGNIDTSHTYDGTHLTQEGSALLRDNYLFELNSLYWEEVRSKCPKSQS